MPATGPRPTSLRLGTRRRRVGRATAPQPRGGDDNGKPSLAEALSGWSLPGGRNGAEATETAASAKDAGRNRSLADLADAARRAARAVVTDGVTTLGTPEESVRATLAPRGPGSPRRLQATQPRPRRKPRPGRPGRPGGARPPRLPAPDPAPATAPTSLSLPKRPATRRRATTPKQTAPKQSAAPKPADEPATS